MDPDIRFSNRSRWATNPLVLNLPEAGFPIDDALAAIREFTERHGHAPTANSWIEAGMRPCEKTIRSRFGSFRRAIAAAQDDPG